MPGMTFVPIPLLIKETCLQAEDTEGAVCVEREARPVGLARAETFLGQFPSNYETLQQPLPLSGPGVPISPPAPRRVPACSSGPKLATLARVQKPSFLSVR